MFNSVKKIATASLLIASFHSVAGQEAPSTVDATYVKPSATRILNPEEKIGSLFTLNNTQSYILQRLSERTYWVQTGFYSTVFYVGKDGVLLFDPLMSGGEVLKQAIASVTDLPVSAVVYSHNHADHISDIGLFIEANPDLEIIASEATVNEQKHLDSKLPKATKIIDWPNGSFKFDGVTVEVHGFDHAAHSSDHAIWTLNEEKIAHIPDMINPDQPPFWSFAGSETFMNYEANIEQLAQLDWTFFNGGHGNIGGRKDIEFYREFVADLKLAVGKAMGSVKWGTGVDAAKVTAHTEFLPAWFDAISEQAVAELRPKYGKFYGFESATKRNAEMVAFSMFEYQ